MSAGQETRHQAATGPTCLQNKGARLQGLLLLSDVGHQLGVLRLQLLGWNGRWGRHASSDANWLHGRAPCRAADLAQHATCHGCAWALHLHSKLGVCKVDVKLGVVQWMWSRVHGRPALWHAKALQLHARKGPLHGVLGPRTL